MRARRRSPRQSVKATRPARKRFQDEVPASSIVRKKMRSGKDVNASHATSHHTHHQLQSHLFHLPAELRLQIWQHVIPSNQIYHIVQHKGELSHIHCQEPHEGAKVGLPTWSDWPKIAYQCRVCGVTKATGTSVSELNGCRVRVRFPEGTSEWSAFAAMASTCWRMYDEVVPLMYGQNSFQFGNGPHQLSHCHLDSPILEVLRCFVNATLSRSFQHVRHISFKIKPIFREIYSGRKRTSVEFRYLSDGANAKDEWQRMANVLLEMPKLASLQIWIMDFYGRSPSGIVDIDFEPAVWAQTTQLSVAGITELLSPFDEKQVRGQWALYAPDTILVALHGALVKRKSPFELLRNSRRRGPYWQPWPPGLGVRSRWATAVVSAIDPKG